MNKPAQINQLLQRLGSFSQAERVEAAKAFGAFMEPEALEQLVGFFNACENEEIRRDAANAIGRTRQIDALPHLVSILLNDDEAAIVRAQAAEGLGYIILRSSRGSDFFDDAAQALNASLEHEEAVVRLWCAQALGAIRHKEALPKLEELAKEDFTPVDEVCWGTVSDEARAAIHAIRSGNELAWPVPLNCGPAIQAKLREQVMGFTMSPPAGKTEAYVTLLARMDAIPLYEEGDMLIVLRSDGSFRRWSWSTRKGQTEQRPRWRVAALVSAKKAHPVVAELLPERHADAMRCGACRGRGKPLLRRGQLAGLCHQCWGLGWTLLPSL